MHTKKILLGALLVGGSLAMLNCNPGTDPGQRTDSKQSSGDSTIIPVDLKAVTPGFHFPEDSTVVYGWLNGRYDSASVYKHAWGIWAGLTAQSGQVFQGDSLRVYETWLGIDEVQNLVRDSINGLKPLEAPAKRARTILRVPTQFIHAGVASAGQVQNVRINNFEPNLRGHGMGVAIDTAGPTSNPLVTVSYSPAAVRHTVSNMLLDSSVMASFGKQGGIGVIPAFPNNAVTIKPTYMLGHTSDTLIRIPVWPPQHFGVIDSFPPTAFNQYVYVDVLNRQQPGKAVKPVPGGVAPSEASTCNLNDFVHFRLDTVMAAYINQQQGAGNVAKGDIALLIAMHVTSKEVSNWTWQSFYWTPNPDNPDRPSSKLAADLRKPLGISGAAAHYALTTAYTMVLPNQPISGGTNMGKTAMIGYNPYLEAVFGPSTFNGSVNKLNPAFRYGIQTNCMSCHAMATASNAISYSTDQYVDMNDTMFNNTIQVDFAWSIQSALLPGNVSLAARRAKASK